MGLAAWRVAVDRAVRRLAASRSGAETGADQKRVPTELLFIYSLDGRPSGQVYQVPAKVLWNSLPNSCRYTRDSSERGAMILGALSGGAITSVMGFIALWAVGGLGLSIVGLIFGLGVGAGPGALIVGPLLKSKPYWVVRASTAGNGSQPELAPITPHDAEMRVFEFPQQVAAKDGTEDSRTVRRAVPKASVIWQRIEMKDEIADKRAGRSTLERIQVGGIIVLIALMVVILFLFGISAADSNGA